MNIKIFEVFVVCVAAAIAMAAAIPKSLSPPNCDGGLHASILQTPITSKPDVIEYSIIKKAAIRNDCYGSNFLVLLAIRKAENGCQGREFGVMNPEADNLDKQAGWAAASVVKARQRWVNAGKPDDFITFMGKRYCPPEAHPLNKNWVKNVTYHYNKIKRTEK